MKPGDRLASPHAGRIFASELLGDFAQDRVIVGRAVLRDRPPVHRFRREVGIAKLSDHFAVPAFRIGVFLLHEGDAAKTILQSGYKVVVGQIAFQSHTLFARSIEQEHSRRPDRIEAVEPCRVLFDVGFHWKEVLADELGSLLIFIRLGIQPSAGSSRRSRAEIQPDGARLLLGCGERLIDILAPIHAHDSAPYKYGATLRTAA